MISYGPLENRNNVVPYLMAVSEALANGKIDLVEAMRELDDVVDGVHCALDAEEQRDGMRDAYKQQYERWPPALQQPGNRTVLDSLVVPDSLTAPVNLAPRLSPVALPRLGLAGRLLSPPLARPQYLILRSPLWASAPTTFATYRLGNGHGPQPQTLARPRNVPAVPGTILPPLKTTSPSTPLFAKLVFWYANTPRTWTLPSAGAASQEANERFSKQSFRRGLTWRDSEFLDSPSAKSTLYASPFPSPPSSELANSAVLDTICDHHHHFHIKTPWRVNVFEHLLSKHPNRPLVESACRGLREVFWPFVDTSLHITSKPDVIPYHKMDEKALAFAPSGRAGSATPCVLEPRDLRYWFYTIALACA
jgi:hypothetical protein